MSSNCNLTCQENLRSAQHSNKPYIREETRASWNWLKQQINKWLTFFAYYTPICTSIKNYIQYFPSIKILSSTICCYPSLFYFFPNFSCLSSFLKTNKKTWIKLTTRTRRFRILTPKQARCYFEKNKWRPQLRQWSFSAIRYRHNIWAICIIWYFTVFTKL